MAVMISYSSDDRSIADETVAALKAAKANVWIDSEGIPEGSQWREELMRQLKTCDACVPLISKHYLASEHCRMELFLARSFERKILPIMIDDCWNALDADEATRGLRDIFMMRLFDLKAVGLPITRAEAFQRVAQAASGQSTIPTKPVFVSHLNQDAELATAVARELQAAQVPAWVDNIAHASWR